MKRFLSIFLAIIFCLSLVACDNTADDEYEDSLIYYDDEYEDISDEEETTENVSATEETIALGYITSASTSSEDDFYFQETENGVKVSKYLGSEEIVVIPNTYENEKVVAIDDCAFSNKDIRAVKIGDNVETIYENAFINCDNLETVVCGLSVKSIGEYAFSSCEKLETIILNNGIETLENNCFNETSIYEIEIPKSAKTINNIFDRDVNNVRIIKSALDTTAENYVRENGEEYNLAFQPVN